MKTSTYVDALEFFLEEPATHLFLQSLRTPSLDKILDGFEKNALSFLDGENNIFFLLAILVAGEMKSKELGFDLVQKYFVATERKSTLFLIFIALKIADNENSIVKILLTANCVITTNEKKASLTPFCVLLENLLSEEGLEYINLKAEERFWRKKFKPFENPDFQGFISLARFLTVSYFLSCLFLLFRSRYLMM